MPIYIVNILKCVCELLLTFRTDCDGSWKARSSRWGAKLDTRRSKTRYYPNGSSPRVIFYFRVDTSIGLRYLPCRPVLSTNSSMPLNQVRCNSSSCKRPFSSILFSRAFLTSYEDTSTKIATRRSALCNMQKGGASRRFLSQLMPHNLAGVRRLAHQLGYGYPC
jgi:hypothetical protein